jgi:hypothetical protein
MTLDRSAIMRDAWRRYRDSQRLNLGWDFARCLRMSWTAAKIRAVVPRRYYQPSEHSAVIYA